MDQVIGKLWEDVRCHPMATPDIIRAVKNDISVACSFSGVDRFTYTRNKLQSTLTLLDMTPKH